MKRFISTTLIVILITLCLSAKTYAATDGCPDTWSIDTTQYPSQELGEAKTKLGPNMVQTVVSQKIVEYKGELGVMPKLDNLLENPVYLSFHFYLYGKSTVETSLSIEVKNCPKPQIFKFMHGIPQLSSDIEWETLTALAYTQQRSNRFVDFKKEEDFPKYLDLVKLQIQEMINKAKNNLSPRLTTRVMVIVDNDQNGLKGETLFPIALSQNCLKPLSISSASSGGGWPEFMFGKKCDFAWRVASGPNRIFLLEPFTLDLTLTTNSITCTKGKLTKKVSGTNPKCPKGYKKAS